MDGWIDGWMDEVKTLTGSTLGGAFISIKLNENDFNLIFKLFVKQLKPISHNEVKFVNLCSDKAASFVLCFFLNPVGAASSRAPSYEKCFISANVLTFPAGFGVEHLRHDGPLQGFACDQCESICQSVC